MPNAGFPKRMGDRIVYPRSSPEYFALFAKEAAELGARIIGGCCGTTPEHIRAIAEATKKLHPEQHAATKTSAKPAVVLDAAERVRQVAARAPESKLWGKIQAEKFVVSVEIDPPKGVSIARVVEQVGTVIASGQVDAIDINSGTLARVGMDALALAGALEAHGFETIPHVTTRDANIIGLQAMLLGAWSVGGVRNVLAITGDPPSLGDHPETSGVYEVDSIGLVKILARLNQGTDWAGKNLGRRDEFHDRRGGESRGRKSGRRDAAVRSKSGSRSALRHDAADFRSGALARVPETARRKNADSGDRRAVAADELQTGACV